MGEKKNNLSFGPLVRNNLSELMLNLFPGFSSLSFFPHCADCQEKRVGLGGSSSGSLAGSSPAGFGAGAGWKEPVPPSGSSARWPGFEQREVNSFPERIGNK